MPDRLIRESWCASETIDRLTPFEETVLARLIVNCDDFGRMDGRTNVLCSRLFVTRRDVGAEQMRAAIAALEREGLVLRYAVAGKEYIQMRGWGEHQRIRTQRSKYPAPPDAAEARRGISLAYHAADALPGNAESGQAVLPAGALPEGSAAGQAVSGAAMLPDHVAAHVSPTQTADAGQAAEMLPGNAGNAQAALPGGTVWGDPAGGEFGAHGNAPAENHPYYMAGSVQVPPGAMPGQSGAQANFAIARPAAECSDLPRPAAECRDLPRPAAECRDLPQPAAECRDLPQPAAECSDLPQSAAECRNLPQPAAERNRLRLESESNPNPNPNPNRNPTRSRKSNLHTIPAAPAGATEGARAREAFSEFWEKYPKKAGRAEALEAYLREEAYLQQKTLLAALAEQCKNENWRKERGRFVPRAANWLADHRWEETPLPPAADEGGTGPPSRREQELLRMVNDPIEALLRAEQEEI